MVKKIGRSTVYNNLVSAEKWELVNKENKQLMDEFLKSLSATGRSKETISQYENDLRIFFCWYLDNGSNKHFTEIKKRQVSAFQGFLINDCGQSSSRVKRIKSVLSSLSNCIENLYDDEYPNFRNIIHKIESPANVPVRTKTIVTFERCEEVADKLVEQGNIQLACFLVVACYSGLRKQELTRLLISDFTTDIKFALGNSFYKTSPIKVKGRGLRMESKYLWNKCDKWLKLWIKEREDKNIDCEFLFFRDDKGIKKQMLVATANSFAETLCGAFGHPVNMHCFRHSLATEITKSGLPISVVQVLLGHSNSAVSELYVDIDKADSLEQFNDFFSGKVDSIKTKTIGDL